MSATAHTPAFSMHPTVQQGFLPDLNPSRKTQGNLHSGGGELPAAGYSYPVGAASSVPHPHRGERMAGRGAPEREHHTQRSGFLGDLPPTAARQRALAVENPTPKRHASPSEELEEPLVGAMLQLLCNDCSCSCWCLKPTYRTRMCVRCSVCQESLFWCSTHTIHSFAWRKTTHKSRPSLLPPPHHCPLPNGICHRRAMRSLHHYCGSLEFLLSHSWKAATVAVVTV